ncbi:MAG: glutaredoxin family protein [Candidatus Methanofastidiosia archaeon]
MQVKYYKSIFCPFCPHAKRLLLKLSERYNFEFEEIDVTLKFDIVRKKDILGVPTIEIGDERIVGMPKEKELEKLILKELRIDET